MAVAGDCATAVVLVPSGENSPSPFGSGVGPEIAEFPGETLTVYADDAALAAFGRQTRSTRRAGFRPPHAGREQGPQGGGSRRRGS